ncbi:MAG: type II/IV secretion system ATPase subunit [Candidatus Aenigmarchaeota archaeon]|nr:type II/IV secretion system ATPase subunit [Candidatus Aenigmarchaeota archaeon]
MRLARKIFKKATEGWKKISSRSEEKLETQLPPLQPVVSIMSEEKEDKEKKEIEGIAIPRQLRIIPPSPQPQPEEVSLSYPLIPRSPKEGEKIFAFAKIYWDRRRQTYFYELVEPKLNDKMKETIKRIKELLEQRLDVDLSKLNLMRAKEYLKKQIEDIIRYFKFKLTAEEIEVVRYYIERDFLGLGRIEPLMKDPNIEDISCDGLDIPVFVFHRDPRIGSIPTNIVFSDPDELDSFVIKLAQLAGKSVSISQPLVSGTLPDGSRLQATLATDIARRGSNFTIRKFSEEPLTPIHLINYGTADERILAYLWLVVDYGRSILVAGGTASGKTTLLNVLSLFIRPEKKIVSIEDTAEIILPHPHWVSHVARTPISTGKEGEIDLFQLLKESLRQRPDYLILGEVRGQEAYVLFQQMATGHPSLATIHAENLSKLVDRLTSPPISLPHSLIGSLDIIVFLQRIKYKQKSVRRITEVVEMIEFPKEERNPIVNYVFKWNPFNDTFEIGERSVVLKRISQSFGLSEKEILDEFQRRVAILKWMKEKNITDFKEVYAILSAYYSTPNRVLALIESG